MFLSTVMYPLRLIFIVYLFCSAPEAQYFTSQIKLPAVDTTESAFNQASIGVLTQRVTVYAQESAGFINRVSAVHDNIRLTASHGDVLH